MSRGLPPRPSSQPLSGVSPRQPRRPFSNSPPLVRRPTSHGHALPPLAEMSNAPINSSARSCPEVALPRSASAASLLGQAKSACNTSPARSCQIGEAFAPPVALGHSASANTLHKTASAMHEGGGSPGVLSPGVGAGQPSPKAWHPTPCVDMGPNVQLFQLPAPFPELKVKASKDDVVTQQAVCQRLVGMLSDLQTQYAQRLEALLKHAESDAKAIIGHLPVAEEGHAVAGGLEFPIHTEQTETASAGAGRSVDVSRPVAVEAVESCDGHEAQPCAQEDADDTSTAEVAVAHGVIEEASTAGVSVHNEVPVLKQVASQDIAGEKVADTKGAAAQVTAGKAAVAHTTAGRERVSAKGPDTRASSRRSKARADSVPPQPRSESAPPVPRSESASRAESVGGKRAQKRSKRKDGIHCQQTVAFEGCSAVRCAVVVRDEVWTADWSGKLGVRDYGNVEKVKSELPSSALVWCLTFVKAKVPMVWVGQERAGIPVFHAVTREALCTLTGAHSGNVVALTVAYGPDGRADIWSASNDFSIRCWRVEDSASSKKTAGSAIVLAGGTQIQKGAVLHGHSNGVRCLLRIGPQLWSGSDDRSIRLWACSDGQSTEVVQDAHNAGVICLAIAGKGVWSSGYDGRIKEWAIGGPARVCTREVQLEEPLRDLVPVGDQVWVCGKSSSISIYSNSMTQVESLEGHTSFVSSLFLVDHVETRLVWSSSLGDHSLRVWRHELRGSGGAPAELAAANRLYEEQYADTLEKLHQAEASAEAVRSELGLASAEFMEKFDVALSRAADAEQSRDKCEAERLEALSLCDEERRVSERRQELLDAERIARQNADKEVLEISAAATAARAAAEQSDAALTEARSNIADLQAARDAEIAKVAELERNLSLAQSRLSAAAADGQELRDQLSICQQELRKMEETIARSKSECDDLHQQLEASRQQCSTLEKERDEARVVKQEMEMKYAQLDVFKLDVIARELKGLDKQIDSLRGEAKSFLEFAKRFKNASDQTTGTRCASAVLDLVTMMRGNVRDIIDRCFTETQKLYIGAAVRDPFAAGVLKDGGKIAGYIPADGPPPAEVKPATTEQAGRSDVGSKAHARQNDEIREEKGRGGKSNLLT